MKQKPGDVAGHAKVDNPLQDVSVQDRAGARQPSQERANMINIGQTRAKSAESVQIRASTRKFHGRSILS